MRTVSTWNGRVLECAIFFADRVHPEPTGSSSLVRYVEHAGMEETVRLLVEKLGCSGFVSFDFLLDQNGNAYLIEMNARSHWWRDFAESPCRPRLLPSIQAGWSPCFQRNVNGIQAICTGYSRRPYCTMSRCTIRLSSWRICSDWRRSIRSISKPSGKPSECRPPANGTAGVYRYNGLR